MDGERVSALAIRRSAEGAPFSPTIVSGLTGFMDGLIIVGCGLVILLLYVGWHTESSQHYLPVMMVNAIAVVTVFYHVGLFKFTSLIEPLPQIKKILVTCSILFLIMIAGAFALKISSEISRVWMFSWFLTSTMLLVLVRPIYASAIKSLSASGRLTRNIVIVGRGVQCTKLLQHFTSRKEPWNRVLGLFDDRASRCGPAFKGCPNLGTLDDLLAYTRTHKVDDIIVTLPWNADERLGSIVEKLHELPVNIHLGADLAGFMYKRPSYSSIGGIPMLDVMDRPMEGWKAVIKIIEDKLIASVLLILFAPLMLLIALAIKLGSRGPVFFRQPRYGFKNQVISVYKFRSMYHDRPPEKGVPQATKDDPRITPLGRFLRRTSLDELPQLFNVLKGNMSLVGPRPHAVAHNEEYAAIIGGYFERHKVKPGITGWAQVNGLRGEIDKPEKMKDRVKFDVYYINHWSIWLDLFILMKTAFIVWGQKNAY